MPPHQTVVINVVGLTGALIGENTPYLTAFGKDGAHLPIHTVTPAVTCSVQSTFLTGLMPSGHGIVANGWYFRDLAQVWFWRQSNHLVAGEKVWETARRHDPNVTCAKMFWWYNMYSSADFSVTPRPIYPADGRKIPDIYSSPPALGDRLRAEIGEFPFFHFWGPKADIRSSEWIAEASLRVFDWESPTLTLIYLPHLDYNLQRLGPDHPALGQDLSAIDRVCGKLIHHFRANGARVIVLSEYGMTQVSGAIHINRLLRLARWLRVRPELGLEVLDAGASDAFAVADHQLAHVYVRDPERIADVKGVLEKVPGIEQVLDDAGKAAIGLNHPRSGELVAIAQPDRWFSYYYWL
ncbi:alkaline phosphatase family protein, partial [Acidobacteria bacterium AH-259-G07]|nr:alkaline phosphatase family protein [Acidobacteria bacterium AH-259-G07]